MTQPTQEDRHRAYKLCGYYWHDSPLSPSFCGWRHKEKEGHWRYLPDPYTDDSFTGALVKAVFPLLADNEIEIHILDDGTIRLILLTSRGVPVEFLTASNLNTALIEAYFKIEGEKR